MAVSSQLIRYGVVLFLSILFIVYLSVTITRMQKTTTSKYILLHKIQQEKRLAWPKLAVCTADIDSTPVQEVSCFLDKHNISTKVSDGCGYINEDGKAPDAVSTGNSSHYLMTCTVDLGSNLDQTDVKLTAYDTDAAFPGGSPENVFDWLWLPYFRGIVVGISKSITDDVASYSLEKILYDQNHTSPSKLFSFDIEYSTFQVPHYVTTRFHEPKYKGFEFFTWLGLVAGFGAFLIISFQLLMKFTGQSRSEYANIA